MSYTTKFFKWNVSPNFDQVGVPVGYEAEFLDSGKLKSSLSTFRDNATEGEFSYSYDGSTFFDFPIGDSGKAFSTNYTMRLKITSPLNDYFYGLSDGIVYRFTSDGSKRESFDTEISITDFSIDHIKNNLYCLNDKTVLRFTTNDKIKFEKSFNISDSGLSIEVDGSRSVCWDVKDTKVHKRSLKDFSIVSTHDLGSTLVSGVKTFVNKKNGNFVVSAQTNFGFEIFEIDYYSGAVSSDTSSNLIVDIGDGENDYFVVFDNPYIGDFSSGTLDETYIDTGRNNLVNVSGDSDQFIVSDFYEQEIVNFTLPYSESWTVSSTVSSDGDLLFRGSDLTAVYANNGSLAICRNGVLVKDLSISNNNILLGLSGQSNASHVSFRYRAVYGSSDLEQSSSSSSSSLDSSSSSSSN
jgi:hypothetical protein